MQVKIMGNFGLNGSIPCVKDNESTLCCICKKDTENVDHFLL